MQVTLEPSIAADVRAVGRIAAVPTILQVVARTTGMRFTAIARVTDESWTACAVYDQINFGLQPGGQLMLESTICNEIRQHHEPVVFGHASLDPHFCNHPTPKMYGFESYISIPIFRTGGSFFGTLCALDPEPHKLDNPDIVKTLELFTQLIASQLETEERLEQSGTELLAARDVARIREQFIAVLGHDLRNPLHAIMMGAEVLKLGKLDDNVRHTVARIQHSCRRMSNLIGDVLDFARGSLGGGIPVSLRNDENLAEELQHVVAELRMAHPDCRIEATFSIAHPFQSDGRRIAQLLGNLLSNAIHHGDISQPIIVAGHGDGDVFELSVSNGGQPIPGEKRARLFQPFSRHASDETGSGLGLGLYIAAEIAKGHGGTLAMESSDDVGTRFVFRMPVAG